jgi:hypothetical protein
MNEMYDMSILPSSHSFYIKPLFIGFIAILYFKRVGCQKAYKMPQKSLGLMGIYIFYILNTL